MIAARTTRTTTISGGRAISKNQPKRMLLKQVTWSPVEVSTTATGKHYLDPSDIEHLWNTCQDFREIRKSNEIVSSYKNSRTLYSQEESELWGLESWTDKGSWKRFEQHRECLNKVLDEQDRQEGIDKAEFQNSVYPIVKRINHMHIPFDHERLGALSRDATAGARRAAHLRGARDCLEAKRSQTTTQKPSKLITGGRTVETEPLVEDSGCGSDEINGGHREHSFEIPRTIRLSTLL